MKRNRLGAATVALASFAVINSGQATPFKATGLGSRAASQGFELAQQRGTVEYQRGGADYRGRVPAAPRSAVEIGKGAGSVGAGARARHMPPFPSRGWVRPPSYWWNPGAAVAAGVALGYATAIAEEALSRSGRLAPSHCWFYTNPEQTKGFWDVCPP